ncbi:MAG: glutamine amidotransferase [Myxococcota bacterium]
MFGFDDYNAGDLLLLGDWSPAWIALLVVLGIAVMAVSAYDLRNLGAAKRWTLVALRSVVYALAVVLLLEPAIDLKNISKVKNEVAVIVDTSRSMRLKTADGGETRYDRARGALEDMKSVVEQTSDEHKFSFFSFDDSLEASSLEALQKAEPDGPESNLAGALESVGDKLDVDNLGGVVVVSDGIDTGGIGRRVPRGESLDDATLSALEDLDAPINTLAVADDDGLKDVAVARVLHDDFAFVHNKVSIDVDLQVIGLEDTVIPVSLRREGELLQTREVAISEDKTRYRVTFEFVPKRIGKEIYSVSAPEFSDEVLLENNISHFLLNVIRDKVRVLQVVGRPSWDQRFLRRLLKKNPNFDLISFFILRTDESVRVVRQDELSLIPFPTRELFEDELGSFDLVIFQNFNFGPYNMRRYLSEISQFVRDGGGFVMVGGDLSFASGGYANTPIEDILPLELPAGASAESTIDYGHFRPEVTDSGMSHPITQLAFDRASNRQIWSELPAFRGTNLVTGAKPDATVLARHPTLRSYGENMPVIAVQEVEDGRAMALTSDSTWRWAFEHVGQGGTSREYQVFWNSAIRWLIKDPALKLIQVEIPDDVYAPGETARARVRISKPDYTPAKNRSGQLDILFRPLQSHSEDEIPDSEKVSTVEFQTDHNGESVIDVPLDKKGVYRIRAASEDLADEDILLAVPDVNEFREIIPRVDLLDSMASATDAYHDVLPDLTASSLEFEPPRYVQINRRKVIQLWDTFIIFGLIIVLLGTEWTLRRSWGRL